MHFIKPFFAGSFVAAAILRGGFTLLADFGASSAAAIAGFARIGMSGEIGIGVVGGVLFAAYAARHPFSRAKKT